MKETQFTNQVKEMIQHFITTEVKLMLSWVNALIFTSLNKVGLNMNDYELWKVITLDVLTAISLIVAIGYTINRWIRLGKKDKPAK